MGKILRFVPAKRSRHLKKRISELARSINDGHFFDQNFLSFTDTDDLIELEKTLTFFEKIHQYEIYQQIQHSLESDLDILEKNLKTRSSCFMYPTILSPYRRGINPVKALFNEVQKCLLKFNKNDNKQKWLISLFRDKLWCSNLINAINIDCETINSIIVKYRDCDYNSIHEKVMELNHFKQDLLYYKYIFEFFIKWSKRKKI